MGVVGERAAGSFEDEEGLGRKVREDLVEDLRWEAEEANGAWLGELVAGMV